MKLKNKKRLFSFTVKGKVVEDKGENLDSKKKLVYYFTTFLTEPRPRENHISLLLMVSPYELIRKGKIIQRTLSIC